MVWLRLLGLLFLTAYSFSMGQTPPEGLNPFGKGVAALFFVAAPALYMLPTLEAWLRKHSNLGALVALNVLLGWTAVGWVAALVWALLKKDNEAAGPAPGATPRTQPRPATKNCPYCAEPVLLAAMKCKHCGSDLKGTRI